MQKRSLPDPPNVGVASAIAPTDPALTALPKFGPARVMPDAEFWKLVEQAADADSDFENGLRMVLTALDAVELVSFHKRLMQVSALAYQRDVWAAASIAANVTDLDEFECFLSWLLSKGADAYRAVLDDPNALVDVLDEDEEPVVDAIWAVPGEVYAEKTGRTLEQLAAPDFSDAVDDSWDLVDIDLERRFPELVERFGF